MAQMTMPGFIGHKEEGGSGSSWGSSWNWPPQKPEVDLIFQMHHFMKWKITESLYLFYLNLEIYIDRYYQEQWKFTVFSNSIT